MNSTEFNWILLVLFCVLTAQLYLTVKGARKQDDESSER